MSKSTIAETVGVHLRNEVIEEIEKRAAGIDQKKGTYAALILEKWFADGCPPVTEADRLVQTARIPAPPKSINDADAADARQLDLWKLHADTTYLLTEDNAVQHLIKQLGMPNLFGSILKEHDAFGSFVIFDNHLTHWIIISLTKGSKKKANDGLTFEALPKAHTPRYVIEKIFRVRCADIGQNPRGPVRLSQIPARS